MHKIYWNVVIKLWQSVTLINKTQMMSKYDPISKTTVLLNTQRSIWSEVSCYMMEACHLKGMSLVLQILHSKSTKENWHLKPRGLTNTQLKKKSYNSLCLFAHGTYIRRYSVSIEITFFLDAIYDKHELWQINKVKTCFEALCLCAYETYTWRYCVSMPIIFLRWNFLTHKSILFYLEW